LGQTCFVSRWFTSSGYMRPRLTFALALVGAGLVREEALPDLRAIADIALAASQANQEVLRALEGSLKSVDVRELLANGHLRQQKQLAKYGDAVGKLVKQLAQEAGVEYYEDLRLREVDHGRAGTNEQQFSRMIHTTLFYRFLEGGENGADAYNHLSSFRESVHRECERKLRHQVIVFGHGLTNRIMVMRDLHLSIEQLLTIKNPENCGIYQIAPIAQLQEPPQFICGEWGVTGLTIVRPLWALDDGDCL